MLRVDDIQGIVKRICTQNETREPFTLADRMGAIVLRVPLVNVNGFYQRYEGQDIIYINQDLTEDESVLVCAHELGHMVLHNNINTIFLETNKQVTTIYELEADAFAIQLLQADLNLNEEVPLLNWFRDNFAIRRRVIFDQN